MSPPDAVNVTVSPSQATPLGLVLANAIEGGGLTIWINELLVLGHPFKVPTA